MKFFVRRFTGKNLILDVDSYELISSIKEKIYDLEGILPEKQRLVFLGKWLEDDKSLGDYNIKQEDTIYLEIRTRGGGIQPFEFSNMKNKQAVNFTTTAPVWMQVGIGLNLLGKCQSNGCQAYNQSIICKIGIGKFNIGEQICKVKCPMCLKISKTDGGLYLWNCKYDINGMEVGKQEEYSVLNQIAPKEHATYFKGDDDASKTQWKYLNIETRNI